MVDAILATLLIPVLVICEIAPSLASLTLLQLQDEAVGLVLLQRGIHIDLFAKVRDLVPSSPPRRFGNQEKNTLWPKYDLRGFFGQRSSTIKINVDRHKLIALVPRVCRQLRGHIKLPDTKIVHCLDGSRYNI